MKYLSSTERSNLIVLYILWDYLSAYSEKSSILNSSERESLKKVAEDLNDSLTSIIKNFDMKYLNRLLKEVEHAVLTVKSDYAVSDSDDNKVTVDKDDLMRIINYSQESCKNCTKDKYYLCDKYISLINLNSEIGNVDTDICPFKYFN